MNEIRYETPIETVDFQLNRSIFLAGPTVRGNQPHLKSWRFEAVELLCLAASHDFDGPIYTHL